MEYDNIIRQVGEFGKYQKVFLVIVAISSIFNAMTTFALNFVFGEHAHRYVIFSNIRFTRTFTELNVLIVLLFGDKAWFCTKLILPLV